YTLSACTSGFNTGVESGAAPEKRRHCSMAPGVLSFDGGGPGKFKGRPRMRELPSFLLVVVAADLLGGAHVAVVLPVGSADGVEASAGLAVGVGADGELHLVAHLVVVRVEAAADQVDLAGELHAPALRAAAGDGHVDEDPHVGVGPL